MTLDLVTNELAWRNQMEITMYMNRSGQAAPTTSVVVLTAHKCDFVITKKTSRLVGEPRVLRTIHRYLPENGQFAIVGCAPRLNVISEAHMQWCGAAMTKGQW